MRRNFHFHNGVASAPVACPACHDLGTVPGPAFCPVACPAGVRRLVEVLNRKPRTADELAGKVERYQTQAASLAPALGGAA